MDAPLLIMLFLFVILPVTIAGLMISIPMGVEIFNITRTNIINRKRERNRRRERSQASYYENVATDAQTRFEARQQTPAPVTPPESTAQEDLAQNVFTDTYSRSSESMQEAAQRAVDAWGYDFDEPRKPKKTRKSKTSRAVTKEQAVAAAEVVAKMNAPTPVTPSPEEVKELAQFGDLMKTAHPFRKIE